VHTQEEVPLSAPNDLRRLRFRFLERVFDTTDGDPSQDTNVDVIAPAIGLTKEAADPIAEYLIAEGLIEWSSFGGFLHMTHRGRKEIEQAREEPERSTQHFPPINVINIGHMTGSQIQQGTLESVQQMSQSMTPDQIAAVTRWLEAVRRTELGLAADVQAEVDAQLATIDAQMKSARPLNSVVRAVGQAVVEILKSASTGAAIELAKRVPDMFR
jgi:hypothetical protein